MGRARLLRTCDERDRAMRKPTIAAAWVCVLAAVVLANPIPVPQPASMPLEQLDIQILPTGGVPHAVVSGDFFFDYIPEDVTGMLFPVPPGSTNIHVWQDSLELSWTWSAQLYPTVLPELPEIPMIEWQGPFPVDGAVFTVEYEHDLIERPDEFIYFYANGTGKYFPTYDKTTTAEFDIECPLGFVAGGVWRDETPFFYELDGWHLTTTVQSYYGPITTDLIVSLVASPEGADDNNNGVPDGWDVFPAMDVQLGDTYDVGAGPRSLMARYMDNVWGSEVVVANFDSDDVSVLFNNGDGTFAPAVNYPVGDGPAWVDTMYLDGESGVDLVVANRLDNTVSLLFNNGDNTFGAAVNYPTGDGPTAVFARGRLDDNTSWDMVVANSLSGTVSVLLNNGDGTFAPAVDYPVGSYPCAILVGAFRGQSPQEIIVANGGSDNVSVLLNNGDGTFAPAVNYPVGAAPCAIDWAHMGGSHSDFVVANYGSDTISVLINNGDGTLSPGPTFGTPHRPVCLKIGNLDGEFPYELVVACEGDIHANDPDPGKVVIFRNNSDRTFTHWKTLVTGDGPSSVDLAKVNADDTVDLVVANMYSDNIATLFNTVTPPFSEDCNYNGIPDEADLLNGYSEDLNGNGIPDDCEDFPPGDVDRDGYVNLTDVGLLTAAMNGPGVPPGDSHADCDEDGDCDLADFAMQAGAFTGFSGYFDYSPSPRLDEEAEILALTMTTALVADEDDYQRIHRDLALIRAFQPQVEDLIEDGRWASTGLLVKVYKDVPAWFFQALNTYYGASIESKRTTSSGTRYKLAFPWLPNIPLLASEYEALSEVDYAEPNHYIGTDLGIEIQIAGDGTTWIYDFTAGFGDCPSGCICYIYWTFEVEEDGTVTQTYMECVGSAPYCDFPSFCP